MCNFCIDPSITLILLFFLQMLLKQPYVKRMQTIKQNAATAE